MEYEDRLPPGFFVTRYEHRKLVEVWRKYTIGHVLIRQYAEDENTSIAFNSDGKNLGIYPTEELAVLAVIVNSQEGEK